MGRSILIVTKSGRLTDNDFESSRRAFNTIKNSNPETSFVVVTTPEGKDAFSELTARFRDNDYVLTPPEQTHSLIQNVSSTLSTIPANIVNFHCSQGEVRLTDYVTPNVTAFYQIRREHVQASHIVTKVSTYLFAQKNRLIEDSVFQQWTSLCLCIRHRLYYRK
jgi:hypothetical protein